MGSSKKGLLFKNTFPRARNLLKNGKKFIFFVGKWKKENIDGPNILSLRGITSSDYASRPPCPILDALRKNYDFCVTCVLEVTLAKLFVKTLSTPKRRYAVGQKFACFNYRASHCSRKCLMFVRFMKSIGKGCVLRPIIVQSHILIVCCLPFRKCCESRINCRKIEWLQKSPRFGYISTADVFLRSSGTIHGMKGSPLIYIKFFTKNLMYNKHRKLSVCTTTLKHIARRGMQFMVDFHWVVLLLSAVQHYLLLRRVPQSNRYETSHMSLLEVNEFKEVANINPSYFIHIF